MYVRKRIATSSHQKVDSNFPPFEYDLVLMTCFWLISVMEMICECHICLQVQHHFYLLSLVEYWNSGPTHEVLRKSWQCGESRRRSFDWHTLHLSSQTTVSANQQSCDSHHVLSAVLEKWKGWNLRNWLLNQISKRIICSERRLFQSKDYFKFQGHISPPPEHGDGLQKWSAHFQRKENNLFLHISEIISIELQSHCSFLIHIWIFIEESQIYFSKMYLYFLLFEIVCFVKPTLCYNYAT